MKEIFDLRDNRLPNIRDNIREVQQKMTGDWAWLVDTQYNDYWNFDYDFQPLHTDVCYSFATQHQRNGGTYLIPKHRFNKILTVPNVVVERIGIMQGWEYNPFCSTKFDFTWHPDDMDPLYKHEFATQHQPNGGHIFNPDRSQDLPIKYQPIQCERIKPEYHWIKQRDCDTKYFDFTWHPNNTVPPYFYEFGTQWSKGGGHTLHMPGATEVSYASYPRCVRIKAAGSNEAGEFTITRKHSNGDETPETITFKLDDQMIKDLYNQMEYSK